VAHQRQVLTENLDDTLVIQARSLAAAVQDGQVPATLVPVADDDGIAQRYAYCVAYTHRDFDAAGPLEEPDADGVDVPADGRRLGGNALGGDRGAGRAGADRGWRCVDRTAAAPALVGPSVESRRRAG